MGSMSAVDILHEARLAGLDITVNPDGQTLRIVGPREAAPIVSAIKAHKTEVLAALMEDKPNWTESAERLLSTLTPDVQDRYRRVWTATLARHWQRGTAGREAAALALGELALHLALDGEAVR